jgi:hypothetical protein
MISMKKENVKMNLTLSREFYEFLKEKSSQDYMKTATWVKRFLMKHLLDENKPDVKLQSYEK